MTSIRKKKKPKCDPKASEQMRNWLTKHKSTNSTPPVTFSVFSKVVENLPDIAFQIQCTEFAASNKTLDECALWYYHAFYSNPSIRTKYEFRLRSCPLRVKEKLLQVPSDGSTSEATTNPTRGLHHEWVLTEDGVEVRVNRCGRFLFPVSLATFERYIDKKKVLDGIVRKEAKDKAQRAAMLANEAMCRKLLRKYYNAFYIFPSRRRLERCNFAKAPAALREQLLKIGVPLDELAKKTLEKKSQQQQTTEAPLPPADNQPSSSCNPSSIVSFGVFEKFIINIYDIVWRLKLDEPDYAYKGFEECAYEYYLDFYLTPGIRDKYPYVLAPCTTSMKDRLLALPSPEDALLLLQMKSNASQSQSLTASTPVEPQVEIVDTNQPSIQDEDIAMESDENQPVVQAPEKMPTKGDEQPQLKAPVSFQIFKRYIRNIDRIVQQMLCCDRYTGKTEDECALEYYNMFYTNPTIREQFPFQLKPCPARIRDKLLTLPAKVAISADKVTDNRHSNEVNLPLNSDRKLVTLSGITYEFTVSFETFVRYINYEDLKAQLDKTYEEKKGKSGDKPNDEQTMQRFYYLFYTDERVRKAFKFNFNAAPATLRETLLKMATPIASKEQQSPSKVPNEEATPITVEERKEGEQDVPTMQPTTSKCETTEIFSFDVVEDLGKAGRFKFPVAFETFMRSINYKELIRPLLIRVIQDEAQMAAIVENPMHPQYQKILRRYYHSFYVRPNIRSVYDYRFGNVSAELLQKLLAYAVPLDENANKEMAEAANELASDDKMKAQQEQDNELVKTFPVTFKLFKRCIKNLDEIVEQMLCCEQYKDKSKDECAFEYFKAFYTDAQIRKKFEYTIKPCPAKLRDKLLTLPAGSSPAQLDLVEPEPDEPELAEPESCEIAPEPSAQESEPGQEESPVEVVEPMPDILDVNCNSDQSNNNNILVQSERVLITLQDNTYEFPVSVQTFKRYINYDTVRIELANAYTKCKQKVDKILSDDRYDLILLRRFYHSFYVDARSRKLCNYNFDAAPAEMQNILLQFAVPCPKALSIPSPLPSLSTPASAAIAEEKNSGEEITVNTDAERLDEQVMEQEALPQRQHKAAIRYPISYNIFSNILKLDEVVQQMQQEAQYANASANECKLAYYEAFYRNPEIRQKYKCTLKACPALLREKLLQLPEEEPIPEQRSTCENSAQGIQSVAALYAARKAELERMDKSNVVQYTPHNLATYIAIRTQCPKKRALLEQHFIGRKRLKQRNKEQQETAAPTTDGTGAATVEQPAHRVRASATMEQSTEAAAKTQCSTEVAMKDVESVSMRNSSTAITTTTTTLIAKPTERLTTQIVDKPAAPEKVALTSTVATTPAETLEGPVTNTPAATTVSTLTSTTASMCAPTTVRIVSNTASSQPKGAETPSENSSSSSNMAKSGAVLKKATASIAIPAERAVATGLGNMQITLPATTEIPASAVKAAEEFFAESSKENNIKYLLCTSHGVKKTIWRILSQLSYPEFKTYTSIYKGASLYKDESILSRCYYHVLGKGNWPGNLHLKLQMLPQLLHSKGVQLNAFDLGQLSPKMLHYMELLRFSNLDEIVERNFHARTGHDIEDMQELCTEIRKFYKLCWTHDQWLYQVPQVREELAQSIARLDKVPIAEPMEDSACQLPLCMIEEMAATTVPENTDEQAEENRNNLTAKQKEGNRNSLSTDTPATTAADTSMPDLNENETLPQSVCPSTQLELSLRPPCFVDMENVFPASQVAESQTDPLNQSICPAAEPTHIKEEPIKFLNMMRFSLNSDSNPSSEFKCEIIATEEQIINLDDDIVEEREAADLACFEINNSNDCNVPSLSPDSNLPSTSGDSFQKLLAEVQRLDDVSQVPSVSMWVPNTPEPVIPAPVAETENPITTNEIEAKQPEPGPVLPTAVPLRPALDKKQTAVSRKRPRLMADNVPQLRHEFRPLPIAAMVRIESPDLLNEERSPQREVPTSGTSQAQQLENQPTNELENARTVSQELATDNTLMASSQMQHLLDAPFVSKRKVNVDEVSDSNKNDRAMRAPAENNKCIVFRTLERYIYFSSLTKAQISKYHINSLAVGSPYQQALICVNGQLCNVYGPLLETLFSHCTPSLLADFKYLLRDIGEFIYNSRRQLQTDPTEDLRTRVLCTFMRVATPFAQFRIEFENETREWAVCRVVNKQEIESTKRKPKCDVRSVIRPVILERMKQVKSLLKYKH
ncbi:protein telomere ends associated isoform X2 [Drosophila virilis]|uniref:protein telomere ends associated isoform X2 n=1 Tax=Drosophila virilis TaxID=7244 RepID=UPI001395F85B|nr:protein telomere ends associated isoform X2 [Drosophila virilis]